MDIISPVLNLYSFLVLSILELGEAVTGLYPREQKDLLAEAVGLGPSAGVADILIALLSS